MVSRGRELLCYCYLQPWPPLLQHMRARTVDPMSVAQPSSSATGWGLCLWGHPHPKNAGRLWAVPRARDMELGVESKLQGPWCKEGGAEGILDRVTRPGCRMARFCTLTGLVWAPGGSVAASWI